MTVTATLDLTLRADDLDAAYASLHATLADTRTFEGSEGVQVFIDSANPAHVLVIESWRSLEDDAAYRAWRQTPAGQSDLGSIIVGRPVLTKFEPSDL